MLETIYNVLWNESSQKILHGQANNGPPKKTDQKEKAQNLIIGFRSEILLPHPILHFENQAFVSNQILAFCFIAVIHPLLGPGQKTNPLWENLFFHIKCFQAFKWVNKFLGGWKTTPCQGTGRLQQCTLNFNFSCGIENTIPFIYKKIRVKFKY